MESLVEVVVSTRFGRLASEALIKAGMRRVETVYSQGVTIKLAVPNEMNRFRAGSFASKEPETLDWIDQLPEGCKLWDIGANIGLYSIYAAKKKNCQVVAFEPSVFNLELLARNLFLNNLQNQVSIIPLALSEILSTSQFRMSTTEWGGALSSFGQKFGWDGKSIEENFSFTTLGISLDQAVSLLRLNSPDFIKLDVDGIEHMILKSGSQVLSAVQGVLVEINDGFKAQAEESRRLLIKAGLTMKKKLHAPIMEKSVFANVYNQIWVRE